MSEHARQITFSVRSPIERADLPGLCARVCALLERTRPALAYCDVGDVAADAVTADALARLQLAAQRRGCRIILRGTSPQLRELIAFIGLADVLSE